MKLPQKTKDGTEFIVACEFHAMEIPKLMIEGEIIVLSKLNERGRKVVHTLQCEYDILPNKSERCTNTAMFFIERGFPIQD